jgi:hypothetical protein
MSSGKGQENSSVQEKSDIMNDPFCLDERERVF